MYWENIVVIIVGAGVIRAGARDGGHVTGSILAHGKLQSGEERHDARRSRDK